MPAMRKTLHALTGLLLVLSCAAVARANKVTLDENGVMEVDGKKTFVLSVSLPPKPGEKAPDGSDAFAVLKRDGLNFARIRETQFLKEGEPWTEETVRSIKPWLDAAASQGLHCWVTLHKLPSIDPKKPQNEKLLRMTIEMYKDHPALGAWKGWDEPAWVKQPPEPLVAAYKMFKELDPNHPVVIIQAPTKASLPLETYRDAGDIFGVDIYPVTYPMGKHSDFGNNELSVVADCTKWIGAASKGKGLWMTLQIAWAGTATPGKTLRFPTFPQQRYMAYAAIINGARGLNWQGGERPLSLNARDTKLGWNWTYWDFVMRRLFAELNENSPLHAALIAADSKLPITVSGADDIEFIAREVGDEIYLLAAKREGATAKVHFSGVPSAQETADVLYEEPRTVQIKEGGFDDWFGPNDVHVYRIKRR
jgi:hypothetical protein